MTFARKLTIAFGVMLASTCLLGILSLTEIGGLSDEFENAASKTVQKLNLAAAIEMNVSEMQSTERVQIARLAVNDMVRLKQLEQSFNESIQLVETQMAELGPILIAERG